MRFLIISLIVVFALNLNSCARRVVLKDSNSITVVHKLPKRYDVVRVKGKRLYFFNGRHYKKTKRGYVVVRV
jgi:hypothetical protein